MNCQNCGKELLDNATVCEECGTAVASDAFTAPVTSAPVYVKPENVLTGVVVNCTPFVRQV